MSKDRELGQVVISPTKLFVSMASSGALVLFVAAAIVYIISPIDAIPDFIPVLGQMDDVGVGAAAVGSAMLAYRMGILRNAVTVLMALVGGEDDTE